MTQTTVEPGQEKVPGLSIGTKLVLSFLFFIILLGGLLIAVYQHYVPPLVNDQIELRTDAITKSFASAVLEPVVVRNYLRVNKIAEATAALPDVAYTTVINQRGFPIAGIFGDLDRFDPNFAQLVKQQGFPRDVAEKNRLTSNQAESFKTFTVGGQEILEVAVPLGNTNAEVHVALFTADVKAAVQRTLLPLLILLGVMAVIGTLAMLLIARTVSKPIRELTEQAEAISMGQLNREIVVSGGGEIWQLAHAFSRMQASIKYSLNKLKKLQQAKG